MIIVFDPSTNEFLEMIDFYNEEVTSREDEISREHRLHKPRGPHPLFFPLSTGSAYTGDSTETRVRQTYAYGMLPQLFPSANQTHRSPRSSTESQQRCGTTVLP